MDRWMDGRTDGHISKEDRKKCLSFTWLYSSFSSTHHPSSSEHEKSMTDSMRVWKGEGEMTTSNLHWHRASTIWHTGRKNERRWQRSDSCPPVVGTSELARAENNSPSADATARGVPPRAGYSPNQPINSPFSPATRQFIQHHQQRNEQLRMASLLWL